MQTKILNTQSKLSGFTLVELSIVLVIIGLLAGGILIGQNLIESAKYKSQIKQIQEFDIATNGFKTKFKQIPGDSKFEFLVPPLHPMHGPGDGDGLIESIGDINPPAGGWKEVVLYFPNLYFSGLYKQNQNLTGDYEHGVGKAFVSAKIGTGGFAIQQSRSRQLYYFLGVSPAGGPNAGNRYNFSMFSFEGVLSPTQALTIDKMLDDGLPNSGKVVAVTEFPDAWPYVGLPYPMNLDSAANSCTTSGTAYNVTLSNAKACRLLIQADVLP